MTTREIQGQRIDWKRLQRVYDTTNYTFDHYRLTCASSSIPSSFDFKPGGTLIITQGNAVGRVTLSGSDPMGRWSYQTLTCKDNRNLTIMSVYQVCEQAHTTNGSIKTLTATAQQTSMLRQQNRNLSPRKAFNKDLRLFLSDQKLQGNRILLSGDFNEVLDETFDGLTKLCADFGLVDLLHQITGEDEFATYF